jgi:hemerythrin-like metal-binding protein
MAAISWRKEFETGDPAVDHEHRELIALINLMIDKLADQPEPAPDEAMLGEAYAQISAHFALEEVLMKNARYTGFAAHKLDHEGLLDDLREIMETHRSGLYRARRDAFVADIERWFVDHFREQDALLHAALKRK